MTKTVTTPVWRIEQAIRILDRQIADLQTRRQSLLLTLTKAKEQPKP